MNKIEVTVEEFQVELGSIKKKVIGVERRLEDIGKSLKSLEAEVEDIGNSFDNLEPQ